MDGVTLLAQSQCSGFIRCKVWDVGLKALVQEVVGSRFLGFEI